MRGPIHEGKGIRARVLAKVNEGSGRSKNTFGNRVITAKKRDEYKVRNHLNLE